MSTQLVFLFSPRNEECIEVWKLLKEKNILNTLIKINVDDPKHKIPSHINVLPSLLVRGQNIIKGKDAIIKYFNIPPQMNMNQPINQQNNQPINQQNNQQNINYSPSIDPNTSNNLSNKGSLPPLTDVPFSKSNESMFLNTNELGNKWSDNYSFIDSDITQKHSFDFIDDTNSSKKNSENSSRSVKKSALEQKMETMMSKRNEIKPFKRI